MLRGLYTAGTGMLVERSRMDVVTNNIVNADTLGYKTDTMISRSFADMLLSRLNDPNIVYQRSTPTIGDHNTGVHVDELITSFAQGTPEQTNLRTDLCIVGNGFFAVNTPEGERYTRAGNFSLDNEGYLLNMDGYYVLDSSSNPIQLTSDRFRITEDGTILNLDENAEVGKLRIVEFEDISQLRKQGDSLYFDYGGANPQEAEGSQVLQGYIETSNVSIAAEMVDMIITNRTYEANQSALRMIDSTLELAANNIARF